MACSYDRYRDGVGTVVFDRDDTRAPMHAFGAYSAPRPSQNGIPIHEPGGIAEMPE